MSDGSLKLPNNLGAPIPRTPVQKQIHEKWETFNEVQEELAVRGFTDSTRPNESSFPTLTAHDLTNPNSAEYSARYVEFLSWWRYTAEQFANIKSHILQVENEMEDIALETKKSEKEQQAAGAKKQTKDDIELTIATLPRYRDLKLLLQKATQAKLTLEIRLESLERSMKMVSRQVEIRRLDIEQGKIDHNLPTRGTQFPALRVPPGGPFGSR